MAWNWLSLWPLLGAAGALYAALGAFQLRSRAMIGVSVAGALLAAFGFWVKARLEEGFLREQLGAEAYDAYRRRVPMLVPFGPA